MGDIEGKGGAFQAVARALEVQFSFSDSASRLLGVCNTEGRVKTAAFSEGGPNR